MKRFAGAIAILALALFAAAQDKPADTGMQAPKPAPEMQKLIKAFAGTWTTAEKFEPSPMMPKGGSSKGMATFRPGPGGMSVLEEYKSPHGAMGPFMGHGVIWWDADSKAYKSLWCDSMTPKCEIGTSRWAGDTIVADPTPMEMPGGQKMVMTGKYTDIKPGSFAFTMGMGPTAEQAQKTMTITYTKAAAKPAAKPEAAKKE